MHAHEILFGLAFLKQNVAVNAVVYLLSWEIGKENRSEDPNKALTAKKSIDIEVWVVIDLRFGL